MKYQFFVMSSIICVVVAKKALSVPKFNLSGTTVTVKQARGVKPESLVLVPNSFHEAQSSNGKILIAWVM